ncbi:MULTISPECIES: ribonuclease E activity regulator RraA [Auritidibacter]|uniref:4-hydroxy-4-methyl-2-oxoglutarate aldolase n=1 Tax=Auritidibacter ignavus TaxID=678932 RepID=A0AAJ6DCZ3_9MICC|nr:MULTISPECIES: ribonuclease E activity regulator RraA [Auritidibacter]NIH70387.1 regulator of ribonuclease activity A [Auritidibacter ignavus]PXA76405.1 S-adenosylmethionine--2-demethylmenaquinone methyltransferase [Auritidibacter sp. NML100628]PXA81385.1 S-adenosylmethionine--2-demethylmenaquinone methyltransferase [Auritidibacter sp. NML120636]RMX23626.1 RraA family protein [Auritidibacter ignavus]WGH82332.1 ribonuclease E activity regulator RraA [Auritidibacter ignavus]
MTTPLNTTDLADHLGESVRSCPIQLRNFGGVQKFAGQIATVRCFEDNTEVRATLSTPGEGRVLVVDGGGSLNRALLGDNIAQLAIDNNWAGVIVHGAIRDSAEIAEMAIGVKALGTNSQKSRKEGLGVTNVNLVIGGIEFIPGEYVYSDADGIVVTSDPVELDDTE